MRKHFGRACYAGGIIFRRPYSCAQGLVHIKSVLPLCHGVGEKRCRMVTDHGTCIVAGKFPHGKYTALLCLKQK